MRNKDFYINFCERGPVHEDLDTRDLEILDTVSPTTITEFIQLYASDRSFAPPTSSMVFDSEISEIDIDVDTSPELAYDFEEAFDEDKDARARD